MINVTCDKCGEIISENEPMNFTGVEMHLCQRCKKLFYKWLEGEVN